jgi:hypothetical protein
MVGMRAIETCVLCVACSSPLTGTDLNTEFEGIVRERASLEFPCPTQSLVIEDLGGEAYRATGCGFFADYECEYSWSDSNGNNGAFLYVCKRAAQDNPTPLPDGG